MTGACGRGGEGSAAQGSGGSGVVFRREAGGAERGVLPGGVRGRERLSPRRRSTAASGRSSGRGSRFGRSSRRRGISWTRSRSEGEYLREEGQRRRHVNRKPAEESLGTTELTTVVAKWWLSQEYPSVLGCLVWHANVRTPNDLMNVYDDAYEETDLSGLFGRVGTGTGRR